MKRFFVLLFYCANLSAGLFADEQDEKKTTQEEAAAEKSAPSNCAARIEDLLIEPLGEDTPGLVFNQINWKKILWSDLVTWVDPTQSYKEHSGFPPPDELFRLFGVDSHNQDELKAFKKLMVSLARLASEFSWTLDRHLPILPDEAFHKTDEWTHYQLLMMFLTQRLLFLGNDPQEAAQQAFLEPNQRSVNKEYFWQKPFHYLNIQSFFVNLSSTLIWIKVKGYRWGVNSNFMTPALNEDVYRAILFLRAQNGRRDAPAVNRLSDLPPNQQADAVTEIRGRWIANLRDNFDLDPRAASIPELRPEGINLRAIQDLEIKTLDNHKSEDPQHLPNTPRLLAKLMIPASLGEAYVYGLDVARKKWSDEIQSRRKMVLELLATLEPAVREMEIAIANYHQYQDEVDQQMEAFSDLKGLKYKWRRSRIESLVARTKKAFMMFKIAECMKIYLKLQAVGEEVGMADHPRVAYLLRTNGAVNREAQRVLLRAEQAEAKKDQDKRFQERQAFLGMFAAQADSKLVEISRNSSDPVMQLAHQLGSQGRFQWMARYPTLAKLSVYFSGLVLAWSSILPLLPHHTPEIPQDPKAYVLLTKPEVLKEEPKFTSEVWQLLQDYKEHGISKADLNFLERELADAQADERFPQSFRKILKGIADRPIYRNGLNQDKKLLAEEQIIFILTAYRLKHLERFAEIERVQSTIHPTSAPSK